MSWEGFEERSYCDGLRQPPLGHTVSDGTPRQRTIHLADEQARELERLAAQEHRSLDEVVQLALGDYLARRKLDRSEWLRRLDDVVARIRAGVPPDMTPEEIEADIAATWQEYRSAQAAQRGTETAADAGGH